MAGSPTESTNSTAKISLRISLPHNLILKRNALDPPLGGFAKTKCDAALPRRQLTVEIDGTEALEKRAATPYGPV
jgi:hypothetical protein